MRRICSFHGLSPLLSPFGDERSGTGYLGLKLTIRNQRKAPPGRGWGGLKNPSHPLSMLKSKYFDHYF